MRLSPWRGWGRFGGGLALLAALGAVGCGARVGTVTGKVTYKNTPLKGGNVTFVSEGKPSISVPIAEDGSYKAEKVPAGPVKICVETSSLNPRSRTGAKSYSPPPGVTPPGGYNPSGGTSAAELARRFVPIPEEYADPNKSGLTYTVTAGQQEHEIKIP